VCAGGLATGVAAGTKALDDTLMAATAQDAYADFFSPPLRRRLRSVFLLYSADGATLTQCVCPSLLRLRRPLSPATSALAPPKLYHPTLDINYSGLRTCARAATWAWCRS